MNRDLSQRTNHSLFDDPAATKKIEMNYKRNAKQDHTEAMDDVTARFSYDACRREMWNPEAFSLLYGTPIWNGATADQRVVLNQMYWVAYYAQIISAEIATIYFNQTSAAGLFGIEDFRVVCDMLDLESKQERAHIHAFKTVSEQVEAELFGERLFTFPMRTPFADTMIFPDTNRLKTMWRNFLLRSFSLLSSGSAFIGCQYFLVRGLRTLNGKIVQHQLSQHYVKHPSQATSPIPSQISWHHFMDESYHFNSSSIISHDILRCLPAPTKFERFVVNQGVRGCQEDHGRFSVTLNGIFWHDPAVFPAVYKMLRAPVFGLSDADARELMRKTYAEENEGVHRAYETYTTARDSYRVYVADLPFIDADNKAMARMGKVDLAKTLSANRRALATFRPPALVARRAHGATPVARPEAA